MYLSFPGVCFRRFFVEELVQSQQFYSSQNRALKFLFALYNLLAANSELVCYFIIVLNNLVTASVISLVLPILIFLWAMLAVPRPTKKFWMTAIVFTEVGLSETWNQTINHFCETQRGVIVL